jgi:outer membrane lipoprotein-sorting protein
MRRVTWIVTIVISLALVATGCGKRDADSVVKNLNHVINNLGDSSYTGSGRMVLNTGQQPQEYGVEVWYQSPKLYRISLTNEKRDITQIVLRNEEGVFVLTPHLNKSFRFQSDWPDNQGQVYLYQSLAQSILLDQERHFTTENNNYVFDVVANYNNATLARQKIWLNKKDLAPVKVEVSDPSDNIIVIMDFKQFEFGKKFDKDSFDMQRNMTSYKMDALQTMIDGNASSKNSMNDNEQAKTNTPVIGPDGKQLPFNAIEPAYYPEGVANTEMTVVKYGQDEGLMMRFKGRYNYNLIEVKPQEKAAASVLKGEVVDLGYTLAVMTGSDNLKTLMWTYDGVEYHLSTGDLPKEEMIQVAQSIQQGEMGK